MDKSNPVAAQQDTLNAEKTKQMDELADKLFEMVDELSTDSSDFQAFESKALELGNALVRRALKKT